MITVVVLLYDYYCYVITVVVLLYYYYCYAAVYKVRANHARYYLVRQGYMDGPTNQCGNLPWRSVRTVPSLLRRKEAEILLVSII